MISLWLISLLSIELYTKVFQHFHFLGLYLRGKMCHSAIQGIEFLSHRTYTVQMLTLYIYENCLWIYDCLFNKIIVKLLSRWAITLRLVKPCNSWIIKKTINEIIFWKDIQKLTRGFNIMKLKLWEFQVLWKFKKFIYNISFFG